MKIRKVYEEESETYYEELGYDEYMTTYLSKAYEIWCAAEDLEFLSADEFDLRKLTDQQAEYIKAFITLWDITVKLEYKYDNNNYVADLRSKKYNL